MIALLSSKRAADAEAPLPNYFFGGLRGPGSLTHPPVVPVSIWQMHAPLQGMVALQVPLHTGSRLVGVRSCRAETVPAQRTAVAIAARNVFLIVLLMILFLSITSPEMNKVRLFCRLGCHQEARTYPFSGRNEARAGNVAARHFLGAGTVADSDGGSLTQLARGNRSRTKNSGGHRRKDRVLDCLTHDSPFPFCKRRG